MTNSIFVSDLHHLASRSQTSRYEQQIVDAAQSAQTIVLGGDIFDFRWSTLGSLERSMDEAIRWLQQLVQQSNGCKFHYLLGNHDCHEAFIQRLDAFADETPEFQLHRYFVRFGDTICLHGDVVDGHVTQDQLAKSRRSDHHHRCRSVAASRIYGVATAMRLHVPVVTIRSNRRIASRIIHYLHDIQMGKDSGVRKVYFGHTHRAIDGFHYDGLTFFNGGAPLPSLHFKLLEMQLETRIAEGM